MSKITLDKNKVPFDLGFAPYTLVFSTTYLYMEAEVRKFKNINQRKMKYKSLESSILKLCDNLISFYLCGMLYGAYLKNNYKNEPKEISGNDFLELTEEECQKGDVIIEVQTLAKFIKSNDRNPFSSRKINPKYDFIIDNYIEFLEINKYFTNVKTTDDIKIPKGFAYINRYGTEKLNVLFETLMDCINSKKIEKILNSQYFETIKVQK